VKLSDLLLRGRSRRGDPVGAPEGLTREEFEAALADLPSDVDPEELREFVEARGEPACPMFRERLRALLWGWARHGYPTAPARRARHHLN
jgi:hypothetical protein